MTTLSPIEIVTAAIEGTGLEIQPYPGRHHASAIVLPTSTDPVILAVLAGSLFNSDTTRLVLEPGRELPSDPGFRNVIRATLTTTATAIAMSQEDGPARDAVRAFVHRMLFPAPVLMGEKSDLGIQDKPKRPTVLPRPWSEFADAGMFWWINRTLHLFGWVLCREVEPDGTISSVYPARCRYRGFPEKDEEEGFRKVTADIQAHMNELVEDCEG